MVVGVGVKVLDGVGVLLGVGVLVAVGVGVRVAVGVGVIIGVWVGVLVGVLEGVGVRVAVGVGVLVGVDVGVVVGVWVIVGVGVERANSRVHSRTAAFGLLTGTVGAIGLGPAFLIRRAIAKVILPTAKIQRKSMASKALFCCFCGSIF